VLSFKGSLSIGVVNAERYMEFLTIVSSTFLAAAFELWPGFNVEWC